MISVDKAKTTPKIVVETKEIEARGLWVDAYRRFKQNKAAVVSLWILALIILFVIVVPMVSPFTYDDTDWDMMSQPPSFASGHWFGTDSAGRDLLVRIAWGGRVSLALGVIATSVIILIGLFYGALCGYVGGALDSLMMRFIEIIASLPELFILLILISVFGKNIFVLFFGLAFVSWTGLARMVRGQTMSLKYKEFIYASRVIGLNPSKIIRSHLIPNVLGIVVVISSLTVPSIIMTESMLSFLGLGVQEPMSSWGSLINDGAKSMEVTPWLLAFPSAFLVATLFCFNFIGDGLRDALDTKIR